MTNSDLILNDNNINNINNNRNSNYINININKSNDSDSDNVYDVNVYVNKIYRLVDEYIESLNDTDRENIEKGIVDTFFFMGLMKYISFNIKKDIDRDNIEMLNDLFSIYESLCNKYKQLPTLEAFANMCSINPGTLSDWAAGEYRRGSGHSEAVKNWKNICKNYLVNFLQNSRGRDVSMIFVAKANYGMVETAPQVVQNPAQQHRSLEEIKADYIEEQKNDKIDVDF